MTNDTNGPRRPRATIVDVARLAQVSIGTVSHVISGAKNVSPDTAKSVEAAVQKLDYRPSRLARSLVQQRTESVGMIIPDITNPYFAHLAFNVEQALESVDFALLIGNSANESSQEQNYIRDFLERQVDGLVIAVASGAGIAELGLAAKEVPVVLIDRLAEGWPGDAVVGANDVGSRLAVAHLVEQGHENIAFLGGREEVSSARDRRIGFEEAISQAGLRVQYESAGPFSIESGFDRTQTLLNTNNQPTAIVAAGDLLAIGALKAAEQGGINVPSQLSIVGYDDIVYADTTTPRLTTVRQPAVEIASEAVRLLLARIEDRSREAEVTSVAPTLVVRESTAPPP